MVAKTDLVHVLHGANDGEFSIAGTSVGSAKRSLRDVFNFSYFAEAQVNGKRVPLDHVLIGGDRLEFIQAFGNKGAKDEPRVKADARGLLTHYPDLARIGKEVKRRRLPTDKSVDLMASLVAKWCEEYFGPIVKAVVPTLNEVIAELSKLRDRATPLTHGKQPRKPGRKNTTRELADFANEHRPEKTWKDIAEAWNKKHPNATEKVKANQVRDAWRRAYGDKAASSKSSKKNRANH